MKSFGFAWPPNIIGGCQTVICCTSMLLKSCHHSKFMHQWVISHQSQRCWAEQAISIWHWSKQNIARPTQVQNKGREAGHIQFSQRTFGPKAQYGSELCSWLMNIFIKKLMEVKNINRPTYWLILFSRKKSLYLYILFSLVQEKFYFSAKSLPFNVNYSHTCVFILQLYINQTVKKLNQASAIK